MHHRPAGAGGGGARPRPTRRRTAQGSTGNTLTAGQADPRLGRMGAEWTMADAWVFAAIASDRPDDVRSLRQVIGIADAMNHAILMEEEFARAIGRLLGAGLI